MTPPVGIAHAGWGAQTHQRAEGVDMPLLCTALVVGDGETEVAIVDLDVGLLSPDYDLLVRNAIAAATGIPVSNIRVSYTHTHSGPIEGFSWIAEGADLVEPWFKSLAPRAAEAVSMARAHMVEARVGTASGSCDINVNRRPAGPNGRLFTGRNWDGFVDHEVLVTAVDDTDGRPIATLLNYACHPTIMGPDNRMITPDYPGPARQVVEQHVGGLCLFLQGAAGNQGPVDGFTGDLAVYRRLGTKLGLEAARVRLSIDPVPRTEKLLQVLPSGADLGIYVDEQSGEPDASLAALMQDSPMPVKELPSQGEVEARFLATQAALESVRRRKGSLAEVKTAAFPAKRAAIHMRLARIFGRGGSKDIPVQVIRLGNTALVAIPVEPFAEIGVAVKKRSPADWTLFSGYSNGYYGYMPMRENYPEGGYEVDTTPFALGAAEQMIEACVQAIEKLWR